MTKVKPAAPGLTISNCTFNNTAAPLPEYVSGAMEQLARAAADNAIAIGKMADALKGAPATMQSATHVDGLG